ncbi:nucleoside hydrolase [Microbacterium nanhaiense]|uniref:Nucleoside hydrolase n=1 Tax=Microbacterium nanhaiense TaxID=1301026 RepID=A0ABQ2N3R0_9MICO|nr:nucleoside hydrolase [Microbacterium nanhaiense]GGO64822.1 nucleoside hydrolase [Microbacterium nanhaiense]
MRVILDTDMGMGVPGTEIDDGFALALIAADDEFELDMVTTVNGNIDVESGTYLSRELLQRLGREEVPVFRGASAPLAEPERGRVAPGAIRERFGHHRPNPGYAAAEIARCVVESPGEITIIAIGPLTNIAAAINLDERVASSVKEIVIMGGAFQQHTNLLHMPGEFNFWVDAVAARAVMRSGAPLRLVGLDATLKVRLTREHAAAMSASGRSFGAFAGESTTAWIDAMAAKMPGDPAHADSCAMHDPLAVAAVSHPELLEWAPACVDVIASDEAGRGIAVADLLMHADSPAPNAHIAVDVDVDGFMTYFLNRISNY